MTAINRQPTGFLGFLGIKNFGRNPQQASEVLAPTWDMTQLYLAQSRAWIATAGGVIGAIGVHANFTPQAGQVWHVHFFGSITATLAAGNVIDIAPIVWNQALGIAVPIGPSCNVQATVGNQALVAINEPLILAAGESIGIYANRKDGANVNYTSTMVYTQLDA